jgi:hypothetical protein
MLFEDARDCPARQMMAKIRKCSLYPQITPIAVFYRHSNNQRLDFLCGARAAGSSARAAVVLACNESPVPIEQRLWGDNRCYICEQLSSKNLSLDRQTATLFVSKPEPSVAQLST